MKSAVNIYGEFIDAIRRRGGAVTPRGCDGLGQYRLRVRNVATISFDVSVPTKHRNRVQRLVNKLIVEIA